MLRIIFFSFIFFIIGFGQVSAMEEYFVTLKNKKVNVRYGPSLDYQVKFIYKKAGLPVKVIDRKENFRRIIDHKNNSGWIHWTQLKNSISFVATSDKILFKKPSKFSQPLAKINEGRLLIVIECKKKWCNIKTGNYTGWIDKNNVWGKIF